MLEKRSGHIKRLANDSLRYSSSNRQQISHLQNLNNAFVIVPGVDGLKHFAVFAAAEFPNQLVVVEFTATTTSRQ